MAEANNVGRYSPVLQTSGQGRVPYMGENGYRPDGAR